MDRSTFSNISIKLNSYSKSIGLVATINYVLQRYILRRSNIILKVPQSKSKITIRRKSSDIGVFRQIFIQNQFLFLKSNNFRVIIDCGANIGLTTVYLKNMFPEAIIFSIEPEKENFKLLQINTSTYENVVLINKALSDDNDGLYLLDNGRGSDSFQTKKRFEVSNELLKIESITIRDIMKQYKLSKLDFVKMDIEGAEFYCITEEAMDWISLTHMLAIEIHELIVPGATLKIKKLLSDNFAYSQQGEYSVFTN